MDFRLVETTWHLHAPQFLDAEWNRVQGLCVCATQGRGKMCLADCLLESSSISLEVLSGALALHTATRLTHRLIPRPAKAPPVPTFLILLVEEEKDEVSLIVNVFCLCLKGAN